MPSPSIKYCKPSSSSSHSSVSSLQHCQLPYTTNFARLRPHNSLLRFHRFRGFSFLIDNMSSIDITGESRDAMIYSSIEGLGVRLPTVGVLMIILIIV